MNINLIQNDILNNGPIHSIINFGSFIDYMDLVPNYVLYDDCLSYYSKYKDNKILDEKILKYENNMKPLINSYKALSRYINNELDPEFFRFNITKNSKYNDYCNKVGIAEKELKKSFKNNILDKREVIKELKDNIEYSTDGLKNQLARYEKTKDGLFFVDKNPLFFKETINKIHKFFELNEGLDEIVDDIFFLKDENQIYKGNIGFYYKEKNQKIFYGFNINEVIKEEFSNKNFNN